MALMKIIRYYLVYFPPIQRQCKSESMKILKPFFSIVDRRMVQQKHLTQRSRRLDGRAMLGGTSFVSGTELLTISILFELK